MKTIELNGNQDYVSIIVGDPHMMGHNPRSRLDFYPDTLLTSFNEINDLAREIDADNIKMLGDLFHSPDVANKATGKLGSTLQKAPCPIYTILGNHDVYGGNASTYERASIGLLEELGIIKIMKDEEHLFFKKGNLNVQVTGQNYHFNIDHRNPELDYCRQKHEEATHLVHLVHGYLVEKKLLFNHTLISQIQDKTEADVTLAGHYHTPYFVEHNGKYFANPGSLERITSAKSEMRMPHVFILRVTQEGAVSLEKYYLKTAKKPEEILDVKNLTEEEAHFYQMNEFLETVKGFTKRKVFDPYQILHEMAENEEIDPNVKQDALEAISEAETELQGGDIE